jgi:dTDP-4-amino-4,6-dideoxygalactose transaminase
MKKSEIVSVMRPQLPSADRLLPYLRRIDETRTYSNWGPLVSELECRLARYFGMNDGSVVCAGSGTAALVGAVLATAGRATLERPLALIPAFTFVATAAAAEQCGYRPYLLDVDADTWMLDPVRLAHSPALDRIGIVIPVAPFGRPVPQGPWKAFRERTGIPVVIDGAACFETAGDAPAASLGDIPVVMSFHATKSFATGEGGCVIASDVEVAQRVTRALNFGFLGSRVSLSASTNGKMSEYHAAVGLAEFDGWNAKRLAFREVADRYRRHLGAGGFGDRITAAPDVCSSYVLFQSRSGAECALLQDSLARHGVEFRLWYGTGLQHQAYFSDCPGEDLSVTNAVAPTLLGLPMALDLTEAMVARVVSAIRLGLADTCP